MTDDQKKDRDIDDLSGIETTGHEWDGLKELNNPLPRWWLWVFYATCVWSLWYFIVYPAFPTRSGATTGTSGYTQFKELKESQNEIAQRQQDYLDDFQKSSFDDIMNDPSLYAFAVAGGAAAFKDNCATCHGSGGEGGRGYPNLNDDDWLWGGTVDAIHTTLLYGIRAANDDTRSSQMPAFGKDGILKPDEINQVADYVLALSKDQANEKMDGYPIFQTNCVSCHGPDGKGIDDFGSPNLTDSIWLYGGKKADLIETIRNSRAGVMPAWKDRLPADTVRQLAIYVHQLGGGEKSPEDLTNVMEDTPQTPDSKGGSVETTPPANTELQGIQGQPNDP